MKKRMNKTNILVSCLIGLLLAALVFSVFGGFGKVDFNQPILGNIQGGTTTSYSSSSVTTSHVLVLSANTGKQYVAISNPGPVAVWAQCNSTTTAGLGRLIPASATMEMIEAAGTMWCTDNLYLIASGGTSIIGTETR